MREYLHKLKAWFKALTDHSSSSSGASNNYTTTKTTNGLQLTSDGERWLLYVHALGLISITSPTTQNSSKNSLSYLRRVIKPNANSTQSNELHPTTTTTTSERLANYLESAIKERKNY